MSCCEYTQAKRNFFESYSVAYTEINIGVTKVKYYVGPHF